jgi:hypothetical protein
MYKTLMFTFAMFAANLTAYAAEPLTLADCVAYTATLNKNYPQSIGGDTIVQNTVCTPGKVRPKLTFNYKVNLDNAALGNVTARLASIKEKQINHWCSNPEQRKLLDRVDIRYMYSDNKNRNIGETNHRVEDCASIGRNSKADANRLPGSR